MRKQKPLRTPQRPVKLTQRKRTPTPIRRNARHRLAIIVPACNEEHTIGRVLREAKRLCPKDIIVVVNGSTDGTARVARHCGAHVIRYRHRLGNDIGRAVGALHCDADVYLFLDADFALTAETLHGAGGGGRRGRHLQQPQVAGESATSRRPYSGPLFSQSHVAAPRVGTGEPVDRPARAQPASGRCHREVHARQSPARNRRGTRTPASDRHTHGRQRAGQKPAQTKPHPPTGADHVQGLPTDPWGRRGSRLVLAEQIRTARWFP
ncbi:MAG: glycosyltransferase [Alicyclobacillaceae bacterium]|nr:glycosyltransferase [Alicyclobacillaceae bacterium]